jgi:hypothetical protein
MRLTLKLLLAALVVLLSSCAQVLGPQTFRWSEADLNQMLQKRFPMDKRVLEVLDMKVTQPAVKLLPGTNRIATELNMQGRDRLFGNSFYGHIAMETGLRYEPSDQTLRMVDVRLNTVSLDRNENAPRMPLQRLGAALVETMLEDAVIHHVNPEQLNKLAGYGYRPDALRVTDRGLELSVVPIR